MTTTHITTPAARWLAVHPAPIRAGQVSAWSDKVRAELGSPALEELVDLLERGDLEQQYQAVAAARALGAEVWADGVEPDMTWLVRQPGQDQPTTIRPTHRLIG